MGDFSKKVCSKSIVDGADEGNEGRSSKVLPKSIVVEEEEEGGRL